MGSASDPIKPDGGRDLAAETFTTLDGTGAALHNYYRPKVLPER